MSCSSRIQARHTPQMQHQHLQQPSRRPQACSTAALASSSSSSSSSSWTASHRPCSHHHQQVHFSNTNTVGTVGSLQGRRSSSSSVVARATPGGLGDEDLDVAVFRFTLGIPGFDDSNIPRVIGAAVAALVAINHALGANPAPPAQVRAEFLDITLAVLCFVAPEIEQRLRQVVPGRGRAGVGQVEGAATLFALADGLKDGVKKELAWASFALLKNVNCCSVLLLQPNAQAALLARGAFASSCVTQGDSKASLQRVAQSIAGSNGSSSWTASQQPQQQQWLPDRSALQAAGLGSVACVPQGVQSALVQQVPGGALLLVLAERPRALSDKDRKWVAAIADKLGSALQQ